MSLDAGSGVADAVFVPLARSVIMMKAAAGTRSPNNCFRLVLSKAGNKMRLLRTFA